MNGNGSPANVGSNAGLGPLVDSEEDPARLWAEIHRLRAAVAGPEGYASWQEAATAERVGRKRAERALDAALCAMTPQPPQWPRPQKPPTLRQRFQAWRERTGFLTDGRDGGM